MNGPIAGTEPYFISFSVASSTGTDVASATGVEPCDDTATSAFGFYNQNSPFMTVRDFDGALFPTRTITGARLSYQVADPALADRAFDCAKVGVTNGSDSGVVVFDQASLAFGATATAPAPSAPLVPTSPAVRAPSARVLTASVRRGGAIRIAVQRPTGKVSVRLTRAGRRVRTVSLRPKGGRVAVSTRTLARGRYVVTVVSAGKRIGRGTVRVS